MNTLLSAYVQLHILAAGDGLPDPVPTQPPGTSGFITLLNWVSWIVIFGGLLGFLISVGSLAFAAFTGREMNGFKGVGLAILVCVLATGAGAIMRTFI